MRSPWLQLLLLFIYFLFILVATRLLDLILWYQHGSTPTAAVNPLLLKVQQIKLLLDSRGVSYSEYLEKTELVQLLQDSGESESKVANLLAFYIQLLNILKNFYPL